MRRARGEKIAAGLSPALRSVMPGDRIFITLTKERAREIAVRRIDKSSCERMDNAAGEMIGDMLNGRTFEEFISELAESIWHNGWEPDIVTVGPEGFVR